MSIDRGIVSFTFGGVKRTVKVPLGLAVDIEEATGKGCLLLIAEYPSRQARIVTSLAIIQAALSTIDAKYSSDEMRELFVHEGIEETHETAVKILAKLFHKPKKSAAGNAPAPSQKATADATR